MPWRRGAACESPTSTDPVSSPFRVRLESLMSESRAFLPPGFHHRWAARERFGHVDLGLTPRSRRWTLRAW